VKVRPATAEELADWDGRTVDPPGGHVYQSRAWAAHRATSGWRSHFLVFDSDGERPPGVLALSRSWPWIGGGSAYIPRGPAAALDAGPGAVADRLAAVTSFLGGLALDVVAADAEVPSETGYRAELAARGFHPIEEIQPSRHRITLPLAGVDEDAALSNASKSTRQRVRKADEAGTIIVRHDARLVGGEVGDGFARPSEPTQVALDRFYDLLLETGERRHFSFGPRESFVAWWVAAHRAGHLVHLEARDASGRPLAGLLLYRHGDRLSTVHSGDHADARRDHPGALHLLRWRAIQLAIREGRAEMDLGGVDVAGARREPREGEPMWGLYQHKLSFGGRWLELSGAHERIIRPTRYRAGRIASRVARMIRRDRS
jgi:lipid II:glycine glycyltransferase (peptidoglycan interpeptide bridge formation enzyme)